MTFRDNRGCDGVNYALATNGGTAVLSSEMGDGETWGPAKFVIDGVREGCVCHSAHEENGSLAFRSGGKFTSLSQCRQNRSNDGGMPVENMCSNRQGRQGYRK